MSIKSAAYNLAETETRGVAHWFVGREIQRLRSYASFDAAYDALEEMKEFGEQADDALSLPARYSARRSAFHTIEPPFSTVSARSDRVATS
jgi:hypothetical protein